MNRSLTVCALALALHATAQAQRQIQAPRVSAVDVSQLEGVTLQSGRTSLLILANATVQRSSVSSATSNAANAASPTLAATFLRKVGPYEIHRSAQKSASAQAASALSVNGKPVPAFADMGSGRDFVGAAYVYDTQQMGLISKEIAVKFKNGTVPATYVSAQPTELVRGSGLYLFTVTDIYAWIKLVSRLQADPQVSLTEPQIVTEFAQAN
jgi:hypothetical protein